MATSLTRTDVVTVRMHRHGLWSPLTASAGAVVQHFVAMQAQEYAYALWATAQRRAPGSGNSAADLAAAADRGEILRTHVLRPTWHFVAPQDARWLLTLTAPTIHRSNAVYYQKSGLDTATLRRIHGVLATELVDGRHRTRSQLQGELASAGIEASGLRLTYAMMHAELEQLIISGASVGKQRSYALFDERVPASAPLERSAALKLLAERYLATRGPASVKDFATWGGLRMPDARAGVAAAVEDSPGRFEQFMLDGVSLWWEPLAPLPPVPAPPRVDLAQCYDEYVMSYSASKHFLFTPAAQRHEPAALMYHPVLMDGLMAGTWKHVLTARSAVVQVAPLRVLSTTEVAAVERSVVDYGAYLGLPCSTQWLLP
ncbi:winged helix DNA-binding domain-containing protein [Arthrobacter sp. HLT1-20]